MTLVSARISVNLCCLSVVTIPIESIHRKKPKNGTLLSKFLTTMPEKAAFFQSAPITAIFRTFLPIVKPYLYSIKIKYARLISISIASDAIYHSNNDNKDNTFLALIAEAAI